MKNHKKKFAEEKIANMMNEIYQLSVVLKGYCKNNREESEEISDIYPLIKYLHEKTDDLNSVFINFDEN